MSPVTPVRSARRGHSELYDRAKGALILLVVIGHAIEIVGTPTPTSALYGAIYLFHMPAFLLIAGALVRPRDFPDELRLVGVRLGLPYLAGALGAAVVALALTGESGFRLIPPPWTLWFLVTLATLRLIASLLPLRALLAASLVGVLLGTLVTLPGELSLARSASLGPFFVIGLALGAPRLERLIRAVRLPVTVLLLVAAFSLTLATIEIAALPRSVLFWRDPLTDTLAPVSALIASGALHLGALAATFGVLALVARIKLPALFELAGRESLTIYLCHAPLLAVLRPTFRDASLEGVSGILAIGVLAVGAVLVPLGARAIVRALYSPTAALERPPAAH